MIFGSFYTLKNRINFLKITKIDISKKAIFDPKIDPPLGLKTEKIVSLISDAGTPAISDPGRILINECIKKDINVYPCPGPSAVSAAISISRFYDQYYFYGFFPEKKGKINKDFMTSFVFNQIASISKWGSLMTRTSS